MTSISRPELSVKWWDAVKPPSVRGKHLDDALADFEKAAKRYEVDPDERAYSALSAAVAAITSAVQKAIRECDRKTEREIVAALETLSRVAKKRFDELVKQAERSRKNAEDEDEEEDEYEDEEEEGDDAPLLDPKRFKSLLKLLAKGPLPFACGYDRATTYFVLDRTRKGAALRTALEKAASCSGATYGSVWAERVCSCSRWAGRRSTASRSASAPTCATTNRCRTAGRDSWVSPTRKATRTRVETAVSRSSTPHVPSRSARRSGAAARTAGRTSRRRRSRSIDAVHN
jgi:hypothetical protein